MEKIGFFTTEIPEELSFLSNRISLPGEYFYYGAALAAFEPEIEKCINSMKNTFSDHIDSFDDFLDNGTLWIRNRLQPLIKFAVDQLALNGCFDMTVDRFFDIYFDDSFEFCSSLHQQMSSMQRNFEIEQQARNEQRVAQRKLNEAEGANTWVERLSNGTKWATDQVKIQMEKDKFYNSSVKAKIKEEFEIHAQCVFDFFLDALAESTGNDLQVFSEDDTNKAFAMFKNLKDGNIPESREASVALEILHIYPFVPEFFDWAVIKYGDENSDIQKIADALNIYIADTKEYLLKQIWANADFSTEESTLIAQKELVQEEARLSYYHNEYHAQLDSMLLDFDIKARTVKKVTYKTREEANKAQELYLLFDKMSWESEEEALANQTQLQQKSIEFAFSVPQIEEFVSEKLTDFDIKARTVNGVEYKTRNLAQKAKTLSDLFNSFSLKNETQILEAKDKFISLEKELDFHLPEYEEKLNSMLQEIDLNERSFDGVEYESREAAAVAKKQYEKLKQLVKDIEYNELEQVKTLIAAIQAEKFTIPAAERVLEKLRIKEKVLGYLPIKTIGIYRTVCSLPVGGGIIGFTFIMSAIFQDIWSILFVISIIGFVAVRKKFMLKYANMFEASKDYKNAAFFYEMAKPCENENYLDLK